MEPAKSKSRSFRRKQVRTVSGTKRVYVKRKPKLGTCHVTGEKLKGVPRQRVPKLKNIAKSSRRPQRPFGGVLSSRAARKVHVEKARSLNK